MSGKSKKMVSVDLGRTDYKTAWDLQKKLVELRYKNEIPDVLLFTEHNPVITMGRAGTSGNLLCSPEELKMRNVELYEIERGGDVTFHGPGQLVIYPVLDLNRHGRDLHRYLRNLEKTIIMVLKEYGIEATIKEGLTGVWADNHKLAAIGVAVSRWIAYHGAALNVNTDLDYFGLITPCGITEYPVGSMKSALGHEVAINDVKNRVESSFADIFDYVIEPADSLDSIIPEPARCDQ
ncbi:MAG: lipoyl(octanoyl) transferase LipB [Candidatus Zixiibacteriota bacterium]|nr:MAG: lipoyl(octanoyl) transferase LipB [candidate division Zixibacteria bacterium]